LDCNSSTESDGEINAPFSSTSMCGISEVKATDVGDDDNKFGDLGGDLET